MKKKRLIFAALLAANWCTAQVYSGPERLGPFHIDRNTPTKSFFKELGTPKQNREPYCYQSQDKKAFLYFETIHAEKGVVGAIFLSVFPNCVHLPVQSANGVLNWKTDKGIELGSSEADVVKAYGKPSSQEKVNLQDPRYIRA